MCGIFGFIGKSNDQKVTFDLLNSLFLKTERRGMDASGFYATEPGEGGVVLDKEPVKSSEYVKRDIWNKTLAGTDVDLFIGHCRQTSQGGGPERINKNNHPHWSRDRKIALVHNGKIPEFNSLKEKYDVESDCDSEILLRMFESAEIICKKTDAKHLNNLENLNAFLKQRLTGLTEIFSRVNFGAMAVAIAERGDDGSRYLYLFRDKERPLHVVDMRPTLGQIFFCSTPEIWREAVDCTPGVKKYIPNDQIIIEVPELQIWLVCTSEANIGPDQPWGIRKFKVNKVKEIDWQPNNEDKKISFKRTGDDVKSPSMKVISRLGEDDVVPPENKIVHQAQPVLDLEDDGDDSKKKVESNVPVHGQSLRSEVITNSRDPGDESDHEREGINLAIFDKTIDEIEKEIKSIKERVHKSVEENQLGGPEFSQILDSLETIRGETSSIKKLVPSES